TEETTISATNLKENTLIQGKNGEELVLTKKGQVMGKTEFNATGGNSVLLKEYHRKSDSLAQWQINFSKYDAQTYAFDHIGSGNHGIFSGADYYPQVGSYDFRYKSVECGKNDKVKVEFDTYPEADSVVFKDKYGVTYPISLKDNVLSFTGVSKADTNYIYAYRGDQKIGKLFLNTYKRQTKYIELVSVNGGTIDKTITAEGLSKIFNCAVVDFKIESKKLDIPDLKTFTHGGSSWHSVYNDDQKKVLEAYDSLMKDDKFYLFFVDNVLNKKDSLGTSVSGYMPRGYNAGFIYEGGSLHTVAHELGHGIGNLEHVFENSSNSGKTANLMDYSIPETATELWHFQWDQIQDPSRVWMKWNKDESEGENVKKATVVFSKCPEPGNGIYTNNYGYDDLDTKKDTKDDHINVKSHDGITYLNVSIKGIKSNEVAFISEDIHIASCDYLEDVNVLQISGINQGEIKIIALPSELTIDWDKKELTERQQIIKDNSLGQIWVNVYNLVEINKTIRYLSLKTTSLNIFNSLAEKYLKEIVMKPNFSFIQDPVLSFDKNSNGIIERYWNQPKDPNKQDWDEYHSIKDFINNKNEIFLIKCNKISDQNWYIDCSINKKDTKIVFHQPFYKQFDDYENNINKVLTIHDYDGKNSEDFIVKSIDLSNPAQPTLIITTETTDISSSKGFAFFHSELSVITDKKAMSIGFSHNDKSSGAVVLEQESDEITGQTLLHEIMHNVDKDVYFDVDKPGNLMHYNKMDLNTNTVIKITKPFEYSPLQEFNDTKNIFTEKRKSQWNDVKR
ncbi:MAG: hypothetical protein J6Z01_12815, partial [Bacteroidales bacterium]|nr:hypothetical protein [Bacteroidales bacterium]